MLICEHCRMCILAVGYEDHIVRCQKLITAGYVVKFGITSNDRQFDEIRQAFPLYFPINTFNPHWYYFYTESWAWEIWSIVGTDRVLRVAQRLRAKIEEGTLTEEAILAGMRLGSLEFLSSLGIVT